MATGKNEKTTDLIVAQKLKDAGIKFCPNGSSIADIKKALKFASERGNGRNSYPEYVAQNGDFLLVIEDKADCARSPARRGNSVRVGSVRYQTRFLRYQTPLRP